MSRGASKIFFLLSGENPTLPTSEVKSILEAEGFSYRTIEEATQLLRVEVSQEAIEAVNSRSAMARVCCIETLRCRAEYDEIYRGLREADLTGLINAGEGFAVRVRRVRGSSPQIDRLELERRIGEMILKKVEDAKVDLENPERVFFGILTGGSFTLGLKVAEIKPKTFIQRNPRRRVFFHPTAMPAKLARCMVNLAQPRKGELVFDPFCGAGSILIEAGLIGCRVLGLDVKRRMAEGSLRNTLHYGVEPLGVLVGDARRPPLGDASFSCIVTDPPYGLSATTLGLEPKNLIAEALSAVIDMLERGRRICLAAPKEMRVKQLGEELGLKHVESHFLYVHRRLTREIAVFERV